MMIVLRAGSATLDLDACLQWLPANRLERTWRIGEQRGARRLATTNGFNLLLADSERTEDALQDANVSFDSIAEHLKRLVLNGESFEVDFGFFLGELPTSVRLPRRFVTSMAEVGVDIVVTAYPSSNEEDA